MQEDPWVGAADQDTCMKSLLDPLHVLYTPVGHQQQSRTRGLRRAGRDAQATWAEACNLL